MVVVRRFRAAARRRGRIGGGARVRAVPYHEATPTANGRTGWTGARC